MYNIPRNFIIRNIPSNYASDVHSLAEVAVPSKMAGKPLFFEESQHGDYYYVISLDKEGLIEDSNIPGCWWNYVENEWIPFYSTVKEELAREKELAKNELDRDTSVLLQKVITLQSSIESDELELSMEELALAQRMAPAGYTVFYAETRIDGVDVAEHGERPESVIVAVKDRNDMLFANLRRDGYMNGLDMVEADYPCTIIWKNTVPDAPAYYWGKWATRFMKANGRTEEEFKREMKCSK